LAVGITLSRPVEVAAALWLAISVTFIAGLALVRTSGLAKLCLSVAAASAVISMSLASLYAVGGLLRIPQMAVTHGLPNSIGFALIGLMGWRFVRPAPRFVERPIPFTNLEADGGFVGPDYFDRVGVTGEATGLIESRDEYASAELDVSQVASEIW